MPWCWQNEELAKSANLGKDVKYGDVLIYQQQVIETEHNNQGAVLDPRRFTETTCEIYRN